jgi:hypothetical protein
VKKYFIYILLLMFIFGCGHNMTINGKERKTIGLINVALNDPTLFEIKHPDTKYKVIWGNVIWGALLFETIIAPIYFYGFSMFEPVGPNK